MLLSLLTNFRWVLLYRNPWIHDIDEAGYLGIATSNAHALVSGGLLSWLSSIETASVQAPVVTATTSLLLSLLGENAVTEYAVPLLSCILVVGGTYMLGARRARNAAALACLLVASCPFVLIYARTFHFALPTAAVLTWVLVALERCRGFHRAGWTLAAGVLVGLLPLTRTMAIAFLPAMLIIGPALLLAHRPSCRSVCNAVLSGAASVCVALSWLGPNAARVAEYLTSFGYGPRSLEYGPRSSVFSIESWLRILNSLSDLTGKLHFYCMMAGLVAIVLVPGRNFLRLPARRILIPLCRDIAFPAFVVVAWGLLILTSTNNQGSAFALPLVPPLCFVAARGLTAVLPKVAGIAIVLAVSCLALIPEVDRDFGNQLPFRLDVPIVGSLEWRGPLATIDQYAIGTGNSQALLDVAGYRDVLRAAATRIHRNVPPGKIVAFGVRNAIFNVNSVGLEIWRLFDEAVSAAQIEPVASDSTPAWYRAWLESFPTGTLCGLVLADGTSGDFQPYVDAVNLRSAALESGFREDATWPLPGGRAIELLLSDSC